MIVVYVHLKGGGPVNSGSNRGQPLPHHIALTQQVKQGQTLKQQQRLIMSDHMQQALSILQRPVLELAELIQLEMEANPLMEYSLGEDEDDWTTEGEREEVDLNADRVEEEELEFSDKDFEVLRELDEEFRDLFRDGQNHSLKKTSEERELKAFQEEQLVSKMTLRDFLISQARETLDTEEELEIAEQIIGNLDETGFLTVTTSEISLLSQFGVDAINKVLKKLQNFDPSGICASNLRESLLKQLERKRQQNSLAYQVVEEYYDELIHNRIPQIQRKMGCDNDKLNQAIYHDIAQLDFHPGNNYSKEVIMPIIPDLIIEGDDGELSVRVQDEDYMPRFRFNGNYLKLLADKETPKETKDFIKQKLLSAKWLMRNIHHRGSTLENIAKSLIKYQHPFFSNPQGRLTPLTMRSLAEELDVHESTIARAVANKYIDTPRGVFPLRFFFSTGMVMASGSDISNKTIQDLVREIIENENKTDPLTDEKITQLLQEKGVECARRTVAKYRGILGLGNTHQRKHHC